MIPSSRLSYSLDDLRCLFGRIVSTDAAREAGGVVRRTQFLARAGGPGVGMANMPPGEDMHDTRDEAAALNNAEWCAAVWRSHGLSVEQALSLWVCAHQTPQYYPNVVTVEFGADPSVQAKFIADLLQSNPSLDVSVKDSFASLDLRAAGMTPLFDARWLARPAQAESATAPTLQWRQIRDEPQLAAWETAWRGVHQRGPRIFRRQLLLDPCAIVLGGFDEHDAIQAGGIAYDAAGALGITNVFGSDQQFIQALGSMRPGSGMVRYAAGDDIGSAVQSGFQVLGSLRIWARVT